jgi:hypothetical protein
MATASFDKTFVVSDAESIKKFREKSTSPTRIVVNKRDYTTEKAQGIQLLKQQLSTLETC